MDDSSQDKTQYNPDGSIKRAASFNRLPPRNSAFNTVRRPLEPSITPIASKMDVEASPPDAAPQIRTDGFRIPEPPPAPEPLMPAPLPPAPAPPPALSSYIPTHNIKPMTDHWGEGLWAVSLQKKYKKRVVLRDVSIHVQRGEAVGLLGPNGAGKTTSFYIISGLVNADGGNVFLDGNDVSKLPMYRRARLGIGYLPQEASIFRGLNVEENIMAVLETLEPNKRQRFEMLDELLNEFSISHLRKSPALALSGGERRRLEIARALASQPHFILLDEPFAGIDPIAAKDIRELVRHLKQRSIGVLITDHNVRDTLDVVDRAYILHDGTVLHEGTPAEIINDKKVREVYLGDQFDR